MPLAVALAVPGLWEPSVGPGTVLGVWGQPCEEWIWQGWGSLCPARSFREWGRGWQDCSCAWQALQAAASACGPLLLFLFLSRVGD